MPADIDDLRAPERDLSAIEALEPAFYRCNLLSVSACVIISVSVTHISD